MHSLNPIKGNCFLSNFYLMRASVQFVWILATILKLIVIFFKCFNWKFLNLFCLKMINLQILQMYFLDLFPFKSDTVWCTFYLLLVPHIFPTTTIMSMPRTEWLWKWQGDKLNSRNISLIHDILNIKRLFVSSPWLLIRKNVNIWIC